MKFSNLDKNVSITKFIGRANIWFGRGSLTLEGEASGPLLRMERMLFYLLKNRGKFFYDKCNFKPSYESRLAKQAYKSLKVKRFRLIRRKLIKIPAFKDFSGSLNLCRRVALNVC